MNFRIHLLSILLLSSSVAMAAERIEYTLVQENDGIEIRDYAETVVAEVTVPGNRENAPGRAFMTLFRYIDGGNEESQKIPMTAPVSQVQSDETAQSEDLWTIAFYMPNNMEYVDTPRPANENVVIRAVEERRMAVLGFRGGRNNEIMLQNADQLRNYLKDNKIAFIDRPEYAFYSPPYVPWFMRWNEVMFELQ